MNEIITNGYLDLNLTLVSVFAIICGICVITTKNPIVSVLFLIGLFANIAIYLSLTGLNFISLAYLIVYIGAVSILFLFIVMLINIRRSELQNNTVNSIPLAIILLMSLVYTIYSIFPYNISIIVDYSETTKSNEDTILYSTSKNWDNNILDMDPINSIGSILYSSHSLWLLITSYILLLAMVGAIVITITPKASS